MAICRDKFSNYLSKFGVTTVRYPSANLSPLTLLGEMDGRINVLGHLQDICAPDASTELIGIEYGPAGNLSGQTTSKLPFAVGISTLQHVLGWLNAKLDAQVSGALVKTLQFQFLDVEKRSASPLQIGSFLSEQAIDWSNFVLNDYVFGRGSLHMIRETYACRQICIAFYDHSDQKIELESDIISSGSGALEVSRDISKNVQLTYSGELPIVFGFKSDEYNVDHNEDTDEIQLTFTPGSLKKIPLSKSSAISANLGLHDRFGVIAEKF